MAAARSARTKVDGIELHHLDWEGAGTPVVCVHGLTRNAHDFDALARELSPERRVLALDVRGRGESDWARADTYALPRYVSDLEAWLDANELDRVVLIGTSMGGLISILFAAGHPGRVDGVVLNDIGAVVATDGLGRIREYVGGAPERFEDAAAVIRWFREWNPDAGLSDDQLVEWVGHALKPTSDGGLGWRYDEAIREQMRAPATAAAVAPDLWPLCEAMPGPTLVVRGGVSDVLSAETAAEMIRRMKDCSGVEVPGVGHAPTLVEPPALDAIRRFLAR